jgi:hypothetical protein
LQRVHEAAGEDEGCFFQLFIIFLISGRLKNGMIQKNKKLKTHFHNLLVFRVIQFLDLSKANKNEEILKQTLP